MQTKTASYEVDGVDFLGHLAYQDDKKRPAILIAHAWRGQEAFFQGLAERFAKEGYVGFAADVYGEGKVVGNDEALPMMLPLFLDRSLLRKRIGAAFDHLASLPFVDANRIVAIGFCFGGLTVLELLRSGANVKGVVCFHGVYADCIGDQKAVLAPNQPMKGAFLALHGARDPLVSQEDLLSLQKELTEAKVNWEINIYGNAAHAFTNEKEHDIEGGMYYEPIAANRSYKAMYFFLEEILS
ncbi:MAG: dienelactone hydrolase family protein [Parachlamydiaceae bacterium]